MGAFEIYEIVHTHQMEDPLDLCRRRIGHDDVHVGLCYRSRWLLVYWRKKVTSSVIQHVLSTGDIVLYYFLHVFVYETRVRISSD